MRKVYLDILPRKKYGNNERIDWKSSVGYKINFVYDDIKSDIEIVNYNINNKKPFIDICYNNIIYSISSGNFARCQLGNFLGTHTKHFKYNIRDIIETKTGNIQIIEQIRIHNGKQTQKGYMYKCLIDNNIDRIAEINITKGGGCNVCAGRKVLKYYNDLWTTHLHIAKLLKYPDIGYEVTHGNSRLEIFICPECNYEKEYRICDIVNYKFSCPICGDGISYPNKFVRNFLDQLNEDFSPEYSPDWAFIKHDNPKLNGKKKYDNLLINRNEIWEIHGLQHYEEYLKRYGKNARTLKEEQENDILKEELARKQGLQYIIIDARYSDLEYIKNSLLNIYEIQRYDLSLIDWLKCHEYACSSLVKVACDYWNNGVRSTTDIGNLMYLNYQTIIKYLKQGAKLDWCDYDPKEVMTNTSIINGKNLKKILSKSVVQLSLNNEYIAEFENTHDIERELNIFNSSISLCCRGKQKTAGGYRWMYKNDYYNNINNLEPLNKKSENTSKPIIQLDMNYIYIKEWKSLYDANKNTNIKNITLCCQNKRNHAGGFKWMYKENYEAMLLEQAQ